MSTEARRSTRDRPAKAPLSRDAVVDAALGVLQREGVDAVTMRRVAAELDTGAASLYVYVANRDELLQHTFDRVAGLIPLEPVDPDRWREQAKAILRGTVQAMDDHPGISRFAVANIPTGDNAIRVSEALLAALRAGGVPDASAAWACDLLMLFATAAAFEHYVELTRSRDAAATEAELAAVQARFAALPAERYPNTVAVLPALFTGSNDERFDFGLDLLINGLVTTPPPTPAPAAE